MFVPRSTRRIRFARLAFVAVVLAPTAAIVAWAAYRHSTAHRDALRREWEQVLGLPVAIASVEHPLPGTVRARGWALPAADGRSLLGGAAIEVETSPAEVRISMAALECGPGGAAVLAALASDWLVKGARFRRDVVVDVASFAWVVPVAGGRTERQGVGAVRVECVGHGPDRAIRIVRREAGPGADEVRIVRSGAGDRRLEVEAACAEPVPVPILAAFAGSPLAGAAFGDAARVRGRLAASWIDGRTAGTASGRLEGVDLAACTAALPARAGGAAEIAVRAVEWRDGRIASCDAECVATAGRIDQRLLDALVGTVGCRAGAAYVGAATARERTFDAAGCELRIDGRGIAIAGIPRLGGALAVDGGRPLLEPPAGPVPPERMAWLLAPEGAVYVPSSGPGAWLMSLLPRGGVVERTSRAVSPGEGGGF